MPVNMQDEHDVDSDSFSVVGGCCCCCCGGPPPRIERERGESAEWVLPTPFCLEKHAIGFNRWQLCVVCSDLATASVGFGPLATIVTSYDSLLSLFEEMKKIVMPKKDRDTIGPPPERIGIRYST
jgi:hypothetical protein